MQVDRTLSVLGTTRQDELMPGKKGARQCVWGEDGNDARPTELFQESTHGGRQIL
jgi:hypothetical protein